MKIKFWTILDRTEVKLAFLFLRSLYPSSNHPIDNIYQVNDEKLKRFIRENFSEELSRHSAVFINAYSINLFLVSNDSKFGIKLFNISFILRMIPKAVALVVVLATLHNAYGYQSGAPKESCGDMIPQHHVPPQTSPFPYAISVQKREIRGGEKVSIAITGTEAAKSFKGFFVQARVGNIPVGRFDPAPGVKLIDCGDSQASGASHSSADEKEAIALNWTAPPGLSETVRFRVTVAQDGGTFWVGHLSAPLVVKSN